MSGGSWVVENQWKCSTCGTVNPGREMRCSSCGKPKEQEAYLTEGATTAAAVTDENLVKMAQGGVNWTCTYCSYQNRNLHDRCERCGAEKAESVSAQPTLGSGLPQTATTVPVAGLPQGATVTKVDIPEPTTPWMKIGCAVALVACCGMGIFYFMPHSGDARVTSTTWKTTTRLEQRTVKQGQGFQEAMPDGGVIQSCEQRQVGTMNCNPYPCVVPANGQCNPHPCNCQNQCRDLGNGFSECQQVCQTCFDTCQVGQNSTCYQQCPRIGMYCRYTYDEWRTLDSREQTGASGTPTFASGLVANGADQRVSQSTELTVVFTQDGDTYEYTPENLADFQRFSVGQSWAVETNRAGSITPRTLK